MTEAEVRDSVAAHIQLLDPALSVVGTEYPLTTVEGKTGFIDILAKDRYGCYTVIEIKKSNQTARSAVQQLLKYASFLKQIYRLEPHQIRCVVVSTKWDELSDPFAELSHFSEYECKGYQVALDRRRTPCFAEMRPRFEPGDNRPLSNFIFFEFGTVDARDRAFRNFQALLGRVPSFNCLLIEADHSAADPEVINPHGFAWVVFTGNSTTADAEVSAITPPHLGNGWFDPGELASSWETDASESKLRTQLLRQVRIRHGEGEYGALALHSLNNTLHSWTTGEPVGFGPMFRSGLFTSAELVNLACGFVGDHPYNFVACSTPSRSKHFALIRARLHEFLATNPGWRRATDFLLGDLGQEESVDIRVFNPLNIMGTLNDIASTGSSTRIPSLVFRCTAPAAGDTTYVGTLLWVRDVGRLPMRTAVLQSYPNEVTFQARAVIQILHQYDDALGRLYGLEHCVLRLVDGRNEVLVCTDETPHWESLGGRRTLQEFVDANPDLIDEVGRYFSSLFR